jgi:hypothetical protein
LGLIPVRNGNIPLQIRPKLITLRNALIQKFLYGVCAHGSQNETIQNPVHKTSQFFPLTKTNHSTVFPSARNNLKLSESRSNIQ